MGIESDYIWMRMALDMAQKAADNDEVPVGAVLVKDNKLIATGQNMMISANDPSAHAEIICMRNGGEVLKNYRLIDTTLYVSLEPCFMCAGALVHARIKRLVFGAFDFKTGAISSVDKILEHSSMNHSIQVTGGILALESAEILSSFFKKRRSDKIKSRKT